MSRHQRHRSHAEPAGAEDGPFVSFTDLLSGIVLMFLLMIALLLMRQEGAVSAPTPPVADLRPQVEELQAKNRELNNKDADTLQKLVAAQNALEALKSDLRNRPRFRPAMAYNLYDRAIHAGVKNQTYKKTLIIYISENNSLWFSHTMEDYGDYTYFKHAIPRPEKYAAAPTYFATNSGCSQLNRNGYYAACSDSYRSTLKREGNQFRGVVQTKDGSNEYSFDTTWEILAFYDDYFR